MDGNQQNQQPPQPKPHPLSFLQGLEWTGGGIMLGIGFFLIVFSLLNYFNILPLSKAYPNSLGWLPHRPYTVTQPRSFSPQSKTSLNQPTASKPITDTDRAVLKEDATKSFSEYLNNVLVAQIPPSTVILQQDITTPNSFSVVWEYNKATASALFTTSPNGQDIVSLQISIPETSAASPSVNLAQTTISQFFSLNPKGTWKCKPLYDMTYCENFWQEDTLKRGINLLGPTKLTNGTTGLLYSLCEHKPDSTNYVWKSCTTEFAKTGL